MIGLKGNQSTTRALNRRLVLDTLRRRGPTSRVELTRLIGLSPSAISGVIAELIEDGYVLETGMDKSKGGRKPVLLAINYEGHRSVGIKLMHDRMQITLTDLSIRPLATHMVELDEITAETVARKTVESLEIMLPDPEARSSLVGVGIAMPGFIDVATGTCLVSHRFGWTNVPIGQIMSEAVGAPVWVDNDVNAFAVAHHLFGLGRQHHSILVFIVGTGLGAALLVDNRIVRGAHYRGGEIGFMMESEGKRGDRSWNDQYAVEGLLEDWRQHHAGADLYALAQSGDADAAAYLCAQGEKIGRRLNSFIHLVDPELVIVGGEAMEFGPAFSDPLCKTALEDLPDPRPELKIDEQNDIWGLAAAALAMQTIFNFESFAAPS